MDIKKNVLKTKKTTSRSNQNHNNHITKQRYKQKWSSNVIFSIIITITIIHRRIRRNKVWIRTELPLLTGWLVKLVVSWRCVSLSLIWRRRSGASLLRRVAAALRPFCVSNALFYVIFGMNIWFIFIPNNLTTQTFGFFIFTVIIVP